MVVAVLCGYGFPARWQLVYHTHIQVAIECHGQCAGYGRGGHHQHVGRIFALAPQFGALCHAETVLFIYHCQSQAVEHHGVLDDGVCAYQYVHITVGQSFEYCLAPFALHYAGEQFHT